MHEALVSNWALPFLSLIRANQTPNARRMPLNPSRPPSRLLRHPARHDPVHRGGWALADGEARVVAVVMDLGMAE